MQYFNGSGYENKEGGGGLGLWGWATIGTVGLAALGLGAWALSRLGATERTEKRQEEKTARTETRQEERSTRTETRQTGHTARTELRQARNAYETCIKAAKRATRRPFIEGPRRRDARLQRRAELIRECNQTFYGAGSSSEELPDDAG
jgi:hypothetical protein